jgi:uncharacterized membrane protein
MFYSIHSRLCVFIATDLKNSSVNIVIMISMMTGVQFPARAEVFLFSLTSRLFLGPILSHIHWIPRVTCLEVECLSINLANYLSLVTRRRRLGAVCALSHTFYGIVVN